LLCSSPLTSLLVFSSFSASVGMHWYPGMRSPSERVSRNSMLERVKMMSNGTMRSCVCRTRIVVSVVPCASLGEFDFIPSRGRCYEMFRVSARSPDQAAQRDRCRVLSSQSRTLAKSIFRIFERFDEALQYAIVKSDDCL
jgi:hypothetical protein